MSKRRYTCPLCGGNHLPRDCQRSMKHLPVVTGSRDPETGAYVPPRGVSVRVIKIPTAWFGDELAVDLRRHPRLRQSKVRTV